MRTKHIWYNCLIKELNVPDGWKNQHGQKVEPQRQDLFWVCCNKLEVATQILHSITDMSHRSKVGDSITGSNAEDFHFMISRNLDFIQYYPWLNMESPGSLWQTFLEQTIADITKLKYICLGMD